MNSASRIPLHPLPDPSTRQDRCSSGTLESWSRQGIRQRASEGLEPVDGITVHTPFDTLLQFLQRVQSRIKPAARQQFLVLPRFDDAAFVEDDDAVGAANGG